MVFARNSAVNAQEAVVLAEHVVMIQKAAALFAAGNYTEAANLYSKLTRDDSRNGDLWIRQGKSYQNAGDARKAVEAYMKGTELGFGNSYISINVARMYAVLNDEQHSMDWIERALNERLDGRTALREDNAFAAYANNPRFLKLVAALPMPRQKMSRLKGWQFDIDLLVAETQRLHPSPHREAYSTEFINAAKQLRKSISSTSDEELELGIESLVVMLNDGHSGALPRQFGKMLQVDLYQFSDGIFVIDGEGGAKGVIGSRVLKIGGKPIEWLLDQIRPFQPHDNTMMYRWTFPVYLTDPMLLRHLGALPNQNEGTVTVQTSDGKITDIIVPVTSSWHQTKLFPSRISSASVPLYLKSVGENFWYEVMPDHKAIYLQINQLFRRPDLTIDELADRLSTELVSTISRNLIIDLRHDNGGNGNLSNPLIRMIAAFEKADKQNKVYVIQNKVYVIVGRNTFSAGQIFITLIERFTNAIFVGEPSSSRPNFTGEDGERLVLPYSGMKVGISFKYHQNSAFDDERQWIPVAVPVELDSSSYFRNEDPVLATIFGIIGLAK